MANNRRHGWRMEEDWYVCDRCGTKMRTCSMAPSLEYTRVYLVDGYWLPVRQECR